MNQRIMKIKEKKAVLVGIDKYMDSGIGNLLFTVKDARSFWEILVDPERGKYDSANVNLMVNESQDEAQLPIKSNIMSSIRMMSR
ncbi:MAG: hypothetical protein WCC63_00700, partial [Candidatus Bathyarchaeia archaeon]